MFLTEPPRPRLPGKPLYICATHRETFHRGSEPSESLAEFTADLAAQYGRRVRDDVLARQHPSYALMGESVRATLDDAASPMDLVLLAYAVPEVDPARCTVTRLNLGSPGDPFGFCVSDQGTAAPFTGLALIGAYLRSDACHRALLLVVEQAEVAYGTPPGTVLPMRDTAVGLVLGSAPGAARVVHLRQLTAIAPAEVDAAVAVELTAVPVGPPATLIRNDGTAPRDGMLCTAPWWALAEELDRGRADPYRLVVVDYEPALRYLSMLTVDVNASG